MILRAPSDGAYRIYNLGSNQVLNAETNPLWSPNSIGSPATDWDFAGVNDAANPTAVLGAVEWNFAKNTQDIFLRNKTSGVLAVYNINVGTNTLRAARFWVPSDRIGRLSDSVTSMSPHSAKPTSL